MSSALSPIAAARRAGVSRWTVVRAIQAGEIVAQRNNKGHWIIDSDSLDAWRAAQAAPSMLNVQHHHALQDAPPVAHAVEVAELRGMVAVVTAERDALQARLAGDQEQFRERLADARAERDAWRDQAQRNIGFWGQILKWARPKTPQ